MNTPRTPKPETPCPVRSVLQLRTALLVLAVYLLVPTGARLQMDTVNPANADRQPDRTTSGAEQTNGQNKDGRIGGGSPIAPPLKDHLNGEPDQTPAYLPEQSRPESLVKTGDDRTTENTAVKANPRIFAEGVSMSNAPGSPKSFQARVVRTTETGVHFEVDFNGADHRNRMGYFLFQLRGLQGRENVRIDFVNVGRWSNSRAIVPMYARGVENLSDLTALRARAPEDGDLEYVETPGAQKVPETSGLQKWHYFKNVRVDDEEKRITVRKRFPNEVEQTYVAHRSPYTHKHHLRYINKLKESARYGAEHLTVHEVGKSEGGRPLHVVELASPADPEAKEQPVVVLTAGEHPDEHAPYQSMRGVINWLLSDATSARALRQKVTVLVVPVLDPDGLARCTYENISYSFTGDDRFISGDASPASRSYARWFRQWANSGRRLDVHLLLHCVEAGETASHLFNYLVEPQSGRKQLNLDLWRRVRDRVREAGYRVDPSPSGTGYTSNRLGGFLERYFHTLQLFVELNSQPRPPARHLTLRELELMGVRLLRGTVSFLYSEEAQPLYRSVREKRMRRRKLVNRYEPFLNTFPEARNPLSREAWLYALPGYERVYQKWVKQREDVSWSPQCSRWFDGFYETYDVSPDRIP